jgi:hypothetical protein
MGRDDPAWAAGLGYKDDKRKGDGEILELEVEAIPGWAPGRSMLPPEPLIKDIQGPWERAETAKPER